MRKPIKAVDAAVYAIKLTSRSSKMEEIDTTDGIRTYRIDASQQSKTPDELGR